MSTARGEAVDAVTATDAARGARPRGGGAAGAPPSPALAGRAGRGGHGAGRIRCRRIRREAQSGGTGAGVAAVATALFVVSSMFVESFVHADVLSADGCLDYEDGGTVRYTCDSPATVAFCILSHTMEPEATEREEALARSLSCKRSDGMHDPCTMSGPGDCDSARRRAGTLDIADMDALWGVCEGVHQVPRYEGRGTFGCPATARDEPIGPARVTVAVEGDAELSTDEVREVQKLLAGMGYAPGPADGVWGPRTGRAFRLFLGDAGLPVTEVPTARSLRVLRGAALSRDEVREAQALLAEMGYAPGPADGRWGPHTERALRSFLGEAARPVRPALRAQALRALRAVASSGHETGPRELPGESRTAFSGGWQAPGHVQEEVADVDLPKPLCADIAHPSRCWLEFAAPAGCYMWLEGTPPVVTVLLVTWSGGCRDGKASGAGERHTRYRVRDADSGTIESEVLDRGSFVDGKAQGRWIGFHAASATQFRIDYVDGEVRREEVHDTRRGTCTVSAFDDTGKRIGTRDC